MKAQVVQTSQKKQHDYILDRQYTNIYIPNENSII